MLTRRRVWQMLAWAAFGAVLGSGSAAQTSSSEPSGLVWTFDGLRPTISTADGRFSLAVRARMPLDGASYDKDSPPDFTSAGLIRRAYLGVDGRAFRYFSYEYRMDFGGRRFGFSRPIVNLARIAFNLQDVAGTDSLVRINGGLIKPIFTYYDSVSSASLPFLERASVANVATAAYGGATQRPGLELAFQKSGNVLRGDNFVASAALTGSDSSATNHHNDSTQIVGRLVYYWPLNESSGIQLGGSASQIVRIGRAHNFVLQDYPEVRAGAERLVSTGAIPAKGGDALGVEFVTNLRNIYFAGEYYGFTVKRVIDCGSCSLERRANFFGWYVEASWILTGETKAYQLRATNSSMATYESPHVMRPVSLKGGGWGAWEVTTRYSDLDLNWHEGALGTPCAGAFAGCIRGGEQRIWAFGLNWYLSDNFRVLVDYMAIRVDRLDAAGIPSIRPFNAITTRVQFTN